MGKRGGISLFVVLGVFILLILWGALYSVTNPEKKIVDETRFAGLVDNTGSYVRACLEQETLKAVDAYGFIGSDQKISDYVDAHILECLNDFQLMVSYGYDISYQVPSSNVVLTDSLLSINLFFPITIKSQGKVVSMEKFSYSLQRRMSITLKEGTISAGTVLLSEDGDFILRADEDTVVSSATGEVPSKVTVKVNDRQFNGLENSIVLGNIIYEGLADGLVFDPPLKVTLRVRKEDLEVGIPAQAAKVAWYDKVTGIWRSYEGQSFGSDNDYYYYSALIDHFTPIAVVKCADTDNAEGVFPMDMVFEQLVEPTYEELWKKTKGEEAVYLLPELMGIANCTIEEDMKYLVEEWSNEGQKIDRSELCTLGKGILRDWDDDDDPTILYGDYGYNFIINQGTIDAEKKQGINYQDSSVTISDGSDAWRECHLACKNQAAADLHSFYSGDASGYEGVSPTDNIGKFSEVSEELFDPFSYGDSPVSLISGDGIYDGAVLTCAFEGTWTELKSKSAKCIIDTNQVVEKRVTLTDNYKSITKTLDKSDVNNKFYATPMTYGYPLIQGISYVGGLGLSTLKIEDDGNGCVQTIDGIELGISNTEDGVFAPLLPPGKITGDTSLCSSPDKCDWFFNNPKQTGYITEASISQEAKIQAGNNYIVASVWNDANNLLDVLAYAKGYLKLIGTGISLEEPSADDEIVSSNGEGSGSGGSGGPDGGSGGGGPQMGGAGAMNLDPGEFKEIFPGIEIKKVDTSVNAEIELPRRVIYYVVKIDLESQQYGFYVTPRSEKLRTTSTFMSDFADKKIVVAINGGGFEYGNGNENVIGYAASDGDVYSPPEFKPIYGGGPTIEISSNNKITMGKENKEGMNHAITGFQTVLLNGKVVDRFDDPNHPNHQAAYDISDPRTSVGFVDSDTTNDYKTMLLIVVDGRGESGGVNMKELALIHQFHGASIAANFDGGGSSTLVVNDNGVSAVVNTPSDPGGERPVANHLGITMLGEGTGSDDGDGGGSDSDGGDSANDDTPPSGNGDGTISNFRWVVQGEIAAGGQPDAAGFEKLKQDGFKTIIDVSGAEVTTEKPAVEGLGMKYIYAPLGIYSTADTLYGPAGEVAAMLSSSEKPVFIHCEHGAHRTGVAIGVYRVRQSWTFEQAKEEMINYASGNWPESYNFFFDVVERYSGG